jgi:hypothetical protein
VRRNAVADKSPVALPGMKVTWESWRGTLTLPGSYVVASGVAGPKVDQPIALGEAVIPGAIRIAGDHRPLLHATSGTLSGTDSLSGRRPDETSSRFFSWTTSRPSLGLARRPGPSPKRIRQPDRGTDSTRADPVRQSAG